MPYGSHPTATLRVTLDAGLAAHRSGQVAQAVDCYRRALSLAPNDPDALNLLGTGLLQLGHAEEALGYLERASRKQRGNPMVLANLGQAYLALERYREASEVFRKAIRLEPQHMQLHLGVATSLALQEKYGEAETVLKRLSLRFPDAPLVWFNLGNALRDQKQYEQAIAAYGKAIELDPRLADAVNNLGSVYQATLRFADAESRYRECLAIDENHLLARFNLASVVMDLGRFTEAEVVCRELIARAPHAAESYTILGAAVGHQGRLLEASACHERAAQIAPDDPKVVDTYAAALMETYLPASGLRWFSRALALRPEADAPRQMLGIALLAHGSLQDGWRHYERRPAALRFREKYPHLKLARSLPAELRGQHICVLREQGLGDQIFFLRFAPQLAARGARITYRASNKIAPMLSRLSFIDTLIEETSPLPPADANLLVGDLPHALGELPMTPMRIMPAPPAIAQFADYEHRICLFWPPVPPSIALEPLPQQLDEMRQRLESLGPAPYIGLTWRAGTAPEDQNSVTWLLYKNIALESLAASVRNIPGTLIALQRNPGPREIDTLAASLGRPIHDFSALNDELESMLAVLGLLDDYIGVSNTNVHLRAAVGKTARVLVPAPAEWRWMQSGRFSPWFPGFSIYRQALNGDWDRALARLKRDLTVNYATRVHSNPP